jgi:hypothetical protein
VQALARVVTESLLASPSEHGTRVYWADYNTVRRASPDGGNPTTLAAIQVIAGSQLPTRIAVDSTSVYIANLFDGITRVTPK